MQKSAGRTQSQKALPAPSRPKELPRQPPSPKQASPPSGGNASPEVVSPKSGRRRSAKQDALERMKHKIARGRK